MIYRSAGPIWTSYSPFYPPAIRLHRVAAYAPVHQRDSRLLQSPSELPTIPRTYGLARTIRLSNSGRRGRSSSSTWKASMASSRACRNSPWQGDPMISFMPHGAYFSNFLFLKVAFIFSDSIGPIPSFVSRPNPFDRCGGFCRPVAEKYNRRWHVHVSRSLLRQGRKFS